MVEIPLETAGFAMRGSYPDARTRLSRAQVFLCLAPLSGLAALAAWSPVIAAEIAVGSIVVLYVAHVLFRGAMVAAGAISRKAQGSADVTTVRPGLSWPRYSILAPMYREAAVAGAFVKAMERLDYPKDRLEVLVLLEGDDAETRAALLAHGLPDFMRIVTVSAVPPRTKPKACNEGLAQATGEFVVIYDAEDRPEPGQLKDALATFASAGPDLACLQARLAPYNPRQSWISALFAIDYCLWFDFMLPGMERFGLALPLGGTSNHFRAAVLRRAGAWDCWNVTEDADLGVRLHRLGYRVATLPSTTFEEAPASIATWLPQRTRWLRGYLQTFLVHGRDWGADARLGWRGWITTSALLYGSVFFGLVNPIFWGLFIWGWASGTNPLGWMFGPIIEPLALFSLAAGNGLALLLSFAAPLRRGWYGLLPYGFVTLFYWVLISLAAYRAVWTLVRRPYVWEKTEHGLAREGAGA